MSFFKHPQSIVESETIGKNTKIWAFTHILPNAKIGEDCNICDHVFVENDVVVGNRVTVKCGVQLWDGLRIEDDVFIGPNVTFTNDMFPRSKQYPENFLQTTIKQKASIGANATILPGISIGSNAMIGAGSVVTQDVPQNAIAMGNPAYITGYVDIKYSKRHPKLNIPAQPSEPITKLNVDEVAVYNLPLIPDIRGCLSFAEYGQFLPFIPKRYFMVFDVASKKIRGEHAHKTCQQYLVCVKGSCALVVDNGRNSQEIVLDRPNIGVYLPPMVWGIQYKFSSDAILLVLASDVYKADDYIRDYDAFLSEITKREISTLP